MLRRAEKFEKNEKLKKADIAVLAVLNFSILPVYWFFHLFPIFCSGDDASAGNTRTHPEHGSEDANGRRYLAGDGPGE